MAFKGRHFTGRCHDKKIPEIPPSQKEKIFPPFNFVYHPRAGWIHPRQIIFDTGTPLPGIRNLGSMIYSGKDLPLNKILDTLPLKCLLLSINDFLGLARVGLPEITEAELLSVRICKNNICFWLVEFVPQEGTFDRRVQRTIDLADEGDGGNQGSSDEGAGVVNAMMFADLSARLGSLTLPRVKEHAKHPMNVAVVDRGNFRRPRNFGVNEATHAMVLAKIIEHNGLITPVASPMVNSYTETATVFDLICALSNRCLLDTVQVINISQGFYASDPHPVLHKVLKSWDKPIVCSAGNDGWDNDVRPHWPSNFYREVDHVISVGALDNRGNFKINGPGFNSNYGSENVTLAARGKWGRIQGTSYAAAWMSRLIATAFSMAGRIDLNLAHIQDELSRIPIGIIQANRTHTGLGFMD
ncbi:MAG: S8/S53 family peptidase [Saprospiraceae bacterium]|nr:S8/S53 family peptidase [Saprospiraceae bacterium]